MWGQRALVAALVLHVSAAAATSYESLVRAATGGRWSRAVVRETDDRGRGLFASERLRRGDLVFQVPKERMICGDAVVQHPVLGPALDTMARETGEGGTFALYAGLAAYVEEQGRNGPAWQREYVRSLPKLWSQNELFRLTGTSLSQYVRWAQKRAAAYWRTIRALPLPHLRPPAFSEQDFRQRMAQVMSRLFAIDFSGVERFRRPDGTVGMRGPLGNVVPAEGLSPTVPCLVPMADMINHDSTPRGDFGHGGNIHHLYRPTTVGLEFRALTRVKPGEELVRSYGQSSPSEMVMTYGFLPRPGHYAERVSLRLGAPGGRDAGWRAGLSRATIASILRASGTEVVVHPDGVSAEGAVVLRTRAVLLLAPDRPITAHALACALRGRPGSIAVERTSLQLLRWAARHMAKKLEHQLRANAKVEAVSPARAALADEVIRTELRIFRAVAQNAKRRQRSGALRGRSEDAVQRRGGLLPVLGG